MISMKQKPLADDCAPLLAAARRGEVELVARGRGQYPGRPLPESSLPGLRSIGYWNAVGRQTWGLPMHRNEGIEFCLLLGGETPFATDHEACVLGSGDVTITRPWQRHRLGDPNIRPCRLFWFIVDLESSTQRPIWEFPDWIGPDRAARRELLQVLRTNASSWIRGLGTELKELVQANCLRLDEAGRFAEARLANLINTLLFALADHLARGGAQASPEERGFDHTIRRFFEAMEASLDKVAEPWSVDEMARSCRVGKSYLTASCRRIFNATPAEQVNRLRLDHARRLLVQSPDKTITEVALATGFNTSQYFATCFRKRFGTTPQQFRKEALGACARAAV